MDKEIPFYDIYDFYYIPLWRKPLLIYPIIGIIFILIIFFLYSFFKSRKTVTVTLWQKVEIEIKKIDPSFFETKEQFKTFYFNLTEILKKFLSICYNLDLEEKTDEELEQYLKKIKFDMTLTKDLIEILKGSRFVKFAGEKALPIKAYRDWELALDIVKRTIPEKQ